MTTWVNEDGLLVRYGADQGKRSNKSSVTNTFGKSNELVLHIDLEGAARTAFSTDRNNDGTVDGFSGLDTYIPAGAKITAVRWVEVEAPSGGTSWEVGTYAIDGTAIDIDGIINWNAGAEVGDDLNTQYTANSYVTFVTVGTYTAGKYTVIVEYVTA